MTAKMQITSWAAALLMGIVLVAATIASFRLWHTLFFVVLALAALLLYSAFALVATRSVERSDARPDDHYFEQQKFEHELIDRKVSWLLTSQTVLFAAYGLSFSGGYGETEDVIARRAALQETLEAVGLSLAVIATVGVSVHTISKIATWHQYKRGSSSELTWGPATANTALGAFADIMVPLAFAAAWILIR